MISKKRKMISNSCHDAEVAFGAANEDTDDQELEDEEKKIDKFFQLIRTIREARDRIMNGSAAPIIDGEDQNTKTMITSEKKKKKKGAPGPAEEEIKPVLAVWNPSFRAEDFAEDRDHDIFEETPQIIRGIDDHMEETIVNEEGCLDLKLSL